MSGRQEVPDPTPVEMPPGFQRPLSLEEQIRRFIRVEASREAEAAGDESFEEADDFEVDEDPDPLSKYELPEVDDERPNRVAGKGTVPNDSRLDDGGRESGAEVREDGRPGDGRGARKVVLQDDSEGSKDGSKAGAEGRKVV